ncbi:MAG: BrnA antitoxin family protein [Nitrospirae bacterium]|nr:BrnA antitoxin family protein [Nitrospirota bacterium]
MKRKEDIKRYTAEELIDMRKRGESLTDWSKVRAMTEEELEASIAADVDDIHEELDWTQAFTGLPPRKKHINMLVDADVLDWFRSKGRGYQTYMNGVLRAFVASKAKSKQDKMKYAGSCFRI